MIKIRVVFAPGAGAYRTVLRQPLNHALVAVVRVV